MWTLSLLDVIVTGVPLLALSPALKNSDLLVLTRWPRVLSSLVTVTFTENGLDAAEASVALTVLLPPSVISSGVTTSVTIASPLSVTVTLTFCSAELVPRSSVLVAVTVNL